MEEGTEHLLFDVRKEPEEQGVLYTNSNKYAISQRHVLLMVIYIYIYIL